VAPATTVLSEAAFKNITAAKELHNQTNNPSSGMPPTALKGKRNGAAPAKASVPSGMKKSGEVDRRTSKPVRNIAKIENFSRFRTVTGAALSTRLPNIAAPVKRQANQNDATNAAKKGIEGGRSRKVQTHHAEPIARIAPCSAPKRNAARYCLDKINRLSTRSKGTEAIRATTAIIVGPTTPVRTCGTHGNAAAEKNAVPVGRSLSDLIVCLLFKVLKENRRPYKTNT